MARMNEALRLNNNSIELLHGSINAQRIQDSISMLTKALRSLKVILVQQEERTTPGKSCRTRRQLVDLVTIDENCRCSEQGYSGTSNYVVYRLFRLNLGPSQEMPNTLQVYISCVIFNLALLHQIQASYMQPCLLRKSILERSLLLYKSCYQVLRNISVIPTTTKQPSSAQSCGFLFLLEIGALNNSAQILYEQDEYDQAREKLSVLESILYIQGPSESQSCFTSQEYQGILSNVLLLKPPTVAVAA